MTTKETKTSQTKGEPNSYEEAQLQINELQLKLAKKDETILELNKTIKQKQDRRGQEAIERGHGVADSRSDGGQSRGGCSRSQVS